MKYYSEVLKKTFDTEKECRAAEDQYERKIAEAKRKEQEISNERKARAKEIEDAYKEVHEAQRKYNILLHKFIEDFGSFHMTFSCEDEGDTFEDLFNLFKIL